MDIYAREVFDRAYERGVFTPNSWSTYHVANQFLAWYDVQRMSQGEVVDAIIEFLRIPALENDVRAYVEGPPIPSPNTNNDIMIIDDGDCDDVWGPPMFTCD